MELKNTFRVIKTIALLSVFHTAFMPSTFAYGDSIALNNLTVNCTPKGCYGPIGLTSPNLPKELGDRISEAFASSCSISLEQTDWPNETVNLSDYSYTALIYLITNAGHLQNQPEEISSLMAKVQQATAHHTFFAQEGILERDRLSHKTLDTFIINTENWKCKKLSCYTRAMRFFLTEILGIECVS